MSKGKKSKEKSTTPKEYHEMLDYPPKLLRILVQVGTLNPTHLVVWLTIVDRFNVNGDIKEECSDQIEMIGLRCNRGQDTVTACANDLVRLGLLAHKYRVYEKNKKHELPCIDEAWRLLRRLHEEGRSNQRKPIRVFVPVKKMPTLYELGIERWDEKNRLYGYIGEKDLDAQEKNPDTSEEIPHFQGKSSRLRRKKSSSGGKKTRHNETNVNETNSSQTNLNGDERNVISRSKKQSSKVILEQDLSGLPSDLVELAEEFADWFLRKYGNYPDFELDDPRTQKSFDRIRQNLNRVLAAGGTRDGWVENERPRLEVAGSQGGKRREPRFRFLGNPDSLKNYLAVLEKRSRGPILNTLSAKDLKRLIDTDPDEDLKFLTCLCLIQEFYGHDCSVDSLNSQMSDLGLAGAEFDLTDQNVSYVGLKYLVHFGELPRWFPETVEQFAEESLSSVFSRDLVVTLFSEAKKRLSKETEGIDET